MLPEIPGSVISDPEVDVLRHYGHPLVSIVIVRRRDDSARFFGLSPRVNFDLGGSLLLNGIAGLIIEAKR